MSKKISKRELISNKLQEAYDLLEEGDGISMYTIVVKIKDKKIHTAENLKGVEEDVFNGLLLLHDSKDPNHIGNILRNFFNFQMTLMVQGKSKTPPKIKAIKPKN